MAKLSGNEILKYEWRQKLVKQKIKEKKAFELEPSGSVVITVYDEAQYDKLVASKKANDLSKLPFYDKDGKTYTLSKFKKSKEFGGGGGSGAGAALTKLTESAQALYCAAAWGRKDYSPNTLQSLTQNVYVDETISNILTKLPEEWVDSCIKGAEILYKQYGSSANLTFHRGSDWVGKVEKKFAALNKQEDRIFSNINKWTPADIWLVDKSLLATFDIELTKIGTLVEFNAYLLKNLDDKKIIGVSLKKIGAQASFSLKNVGKGAPKYNYKGYTIGKRGFFQSGDGYIRYDGGEIQMRYFTSVPSSWQGEIKGQFANQGKVGGGVLQKIVSTVTGSTLTKPSDVSMSQAMQDKLYEYYSELETNPMARDQFALEVNKMDAKWFGSKFLTTEIIYHVHQAKDKDRIISSILGYASSQSELSAPYAKVE